MKTYLIDLDGTMYRGNSNIAGAKEFIDNCLEKKVPFFFLTNNATRTLRQNVEHMEKLGFKGIEEKHFFTSSMAAARIMRKKGYDKAQMIAMDGLAEALQNSGFEITEEIKFVVVQHYSGNKTLKDLLENLIMREITDTSKKSACSK